jgi:hypothetical protein
LTGTIGTPFSKTVERESTVEPDLHSQPPRFLRLFGGAFYYGRTLDELAKNGFGMGQRRHSSAGPEQLICNSRRSFCAFFHWLARRCGRWAFSQFGFAPRCAELRRFTHKTLHTVENDRETICPKGLTTLSNNDSLLRR